MPNSPWIDMTNDEKDSHTILALFLEIKEDVKESLARLELTVNSHSERLEELEKFNLAYRAKSEFKRLLWRGVGAVLAGGAAIAAFSELLLHWIKR